MLKLKPAPIISRKKRLQERAKVQQGINARKEEILTFGVSKEVYTQALIAKHPFAEKESILDAIKLYESEKAKHELSDEALEDFERMMGYINKHKGDELYFLTVTFRPTGLVVKAGKIRLVQAELLYTYQPDSTEPIVQAGSIAWISAGDLYNQEDQKGFVLGNKTRGEIITNYSQVLEVEKKVIETKVIKQEVKTGYSDKELQKAYTKTLHPYKNGVQEEGVKKLLDQFFSNLK